MQKPMDFRPEVDHYFQKSFFFPKQIIKLHAMVISCGFNRECSSQYQWPGMNRGNSEFVVWQYTLAGMGQLSYEGSDYVLSPGSCMMVHIPHQHCYFLPEQSPFWEFVYVCLNGSEAIRICVDLEKKTGPVFPLGRGSSSLKVVNELLTLAERDKLRDASDASGLAYRFAMALTKDLSTQMPQQVKKPELVKKVTEFCLEHLQEPITVDDMATAVGYSRFHFSRVFKEYEGVAPSGFLKQLRLRKAVRLLQLELLSVAEIAERCGFQSGSYFCRAFQKAYGVPPSVYRNGGHS